MIRILLPFPPSVNSLYGNGGSKRGRHKTKGYEDWIKLASVGIKDKDRLRLGPYTLSICLEAPDKRGRDLGNLEKAVSDLLVMHGVIKDDRYCQRLVMSWGTGLPAPCVVIVMRYEQGMAA